MLAILFDTPSATLSSAINNHLIIPDSYTRALWQQRHLVANQKKLGEKCP
jgi:hypothetical protein